MATKNVQIRVDEEMKAELDILFKRFWIDTATATRMFYAQALRTHTLPLDLSNDSEYKEIERAYYESFDPENITFTAHSPEESREFLSSIMDGDAR